MKNKKERAYISIVMNDNPPVSSVQRTCKSCGNTFVGMYCNLCGEKVLEPTDRSLKAFFSNVVIALSFTDNKFFKTLRLIIQKPGFLSREYSEGRRVLYLRPLQLFFVLNLFYFLFPVVQLFNTSLHTQMYLRTHSALVRKMVSTKLDVEGYSYQGYSLMYNEKSTSLAKLLVIVFVLLASLPLNLIYRRRNRYFTDHLTLSVEFATFNLAMNAIFLSVLLVAINKIIHWTHLGWEKYLDDTTLTIIFVMTNLYFLFNAGRTFYNQRGYLLIVKVLLALLGLFLALELYRLVLFLLTYWSL
jgi:hypothetical protein